MNNRKERATIGQSKRPKSCTMLSKTQIDQIRVLHSTGMPLREISRRTRISRNTIKKYLICGKIEHKKKACRLDEYKEKVKEIFYRAYGNCAVVQRLLKEELKICVKGRTLRSFCRQFRQSFHELEAFERYETAPAQQMQIDFGQKNMLLGGQAVKIHFFVAVLGYSRRIFVKAYTAENQSSWLDGIENSFVYYGGVPLTILSDNSKCLVKEHRANAPIKYTGRYENFCAYWKVQPMASSPYHPQSKGKCERAVRYVKENALVGKEFKDLNELNTWLEHWCRVYSDARELKHLFDNGAKTPRERFWLEKEKLLPCRTRTAVIREETRKVDKTGLVRIDNVYYRVPDECIEKDVQILLDDQTIVVSRRGQFVIELDKTSSVYTPLAQELIDKNQEITARVYANYANNPLQRPLSEYEQKLGGGW